MLTFQVELGRNYLEKIIIIGGGGHAKVLISVIKKSSLFEIVGYVDIIDRGTILGVKNIGNDNILDEIYSRGILKAAMGVGQVVVSLKRFEIIQKIKEIGFSFPIILSKDAIVNDAVSIEEGSQVFDGVVINSGTTIGTFSVINTNSTIEHDCIIGNFCHIASSAVLSGGVEIGSLSMIGSNAVVIQNKKICTNCMIGAGSVVTQNLTEEGVYVGNPARKIQ